MKYIATIDGHIFKRESVRTYSHCIVIRENVVAARQERRQAAERDWRMNHDYHVGYASGSRKIGYFQDGTPIFGGQAQEAFDRQVSESVRWLAAGVEGLADEYVRDFDASLAKHRRMSSDGISFYWMHGWCGRPDLAQDQVSRYPNAIALLAVVVDRFPKGARS